MRGQLKCDSIHLLLVPSAESARVLCVLRDLHLLDHFTKRGTVTGAIFTGDPDLLCPLAHVVSKSASGSNKIQRISTIRISQCLKWHWSLRWHRFLSASQLHQLYRLPLMPRQVVY